ncbi:MAG: hypothetical protein WA208_18560 [Thermoanaerobaculia bacterium]
MPEPSELFQKLLTRFNSLNQTRGRVEPLVLTGALPVRVSEQLHESLFLSSFTSFEVFIEDLFMTLLISDPRSTKRRRSQPRVSIRSYPIARELLIGFGPKRYVDWLPIENTLERAQTFLRGGRPFSSLSMTQRDLIGRAHAIRNAIAHRSRFSQEKFEKRVIGNTPLAPRERHPAAFLRGQFSGAPPTSRYEQITTGLLGAAKLLVDGA